MANTAWSATDKSANITLTGSNLIATATGTGAGARAVDKQIAGKFYWECTFNTVTNSITSCGVANSLWPTGTGIGILSLAPVGTCGLGRSGNVYVDGVIVGGIAFGALANGNVICIAADFSARLIWFRLGAAGNWNMSASANPATGAGGVSISLGNGVAAYPVVNLQLINEQITANFGDTAFTGAVPAGFISGFTSGVTSPTNAIASQSALEQFLTAIPDAQVTQAAIEQWATTATITCQAMVTQVALEQWAQIPPAVVVAGGNNAPAIMIGA